MIVTSLSILAVDFTIFPRRYAKTETYGTGLVSLFKLKKLNFTFLKQYVRFCFSIDYFSFMVLQSVKT